MLYIFKIFGVFLVCVTGWSFAFSQNITAFYLKAKSNDKFLTVREDSENTPAVLEKRTRSNELAQLFYFKRIPDQPGMVWIVALKNPELFLKRNGSNVEFTAFEGVAGDYVWSIDYAGYPYCLISLPENGQSALQVRENGSLQVVTGISGLANNTADTYRFSLFTQNKVF